MSRKPGRMYTQIRGQAYCRKEYMGGVPAPRITTFNLGNPNGDFPVVMTLHVKELCQVRHIALEAARITANRLLTKKAGANNFYFNIRIYPHQVLRENKLATGAGADRISSGMRAAFGKAVGTAARVQPGQPIITLRVPVSAVAAAKEALWSASLKLPTPCYIVIDKGKELLV
jgi:large subunit ribosomal protein L10e